MSKNLLCLLAVLAGFAFVSSAAAEQQDFARRDALAISQAVIGQAVTDHVLLDTEGNAVALSSYRGKPLVISLIYTSCYHICPTTTQYLNKVVRKAEAVLGADNFNIITVGFDTPVDTPQAMASFSRQLQVARANWQFLAADEATMASLVQQLGFIYQRSPHGFDHLIQSTVLDKTGRVYRQVYGMEFETPHLVEPLKELIFGVAPDQSLLHQVGNKIRLFCTIYDPASDSYRFDYSIFVGLVVGLSIGAVLVLLLIREWRYSRANDLAREAKRD